MLSKFIASMAQYRGLIYAVTVRDIRSRYAGSVFGAVWLLLPPIFMVFIYTVIFSQIMRARLPGVENQYAYSVYLCSGLITWGLLLELVQRGKNVFLEHANLIKKTSFPRFILFLPVLLVALFNSLILLALVLFFMLLAGYPLHAEAWWLIPVLLLTVFLGVVLGALLAILNVFFRDTGQIADVFFQGLFWATPIVYPFAILSERVQQILALNPVFPLVHTAQNALLGEPVSIAPLAYPLIFGLIILSLAVFLYRRSYADLLDQI